MRQLRVQEELEWEEMVSRLSPGELRALAAYYQRLAWRLEARAWAEEARPGLADVVRPGPQPNHLN